MMNRPFFDACESDACFLEMFPEPCLFRYAYFHNLPQADLPYIKIPLHTVIKLTPKAYGCDEERCESRFNICLSTLTFPMQVYLTDRRRRHTPSKTWRKTFGPKFGWQYC